MVTISHTHGEPRPLSLRVADFLERTAAMLRDSYTFRRNYRQTYRELQGLSDRDLHDLGISRADIERVATESALSALNKAAAERR
ncbi:MAG: DUF1127 domain-containing protein [Paracoccaceae bacterium]